MNVQQNLLIEERGNDNWQIKQHVMSDVGTTGRNYRRYRNYWHSVSMKNKWLVINIRLFSLQPRMSLMHTQTGVFHESPTTSYVDVWIAGFYDLLCNNNFLLLSWSLVFETLPLNKEASKRKCSCHSSLTERTTANVCWCNTLTVCVLWWAVLLNLYKLGRCYFQLSPLSWRSPAKSVTAQVDWVTREARAHTRYRWSTSTQCSTPELRCTPCFHRHVRSWHRLAIWTRYHRFLHDLCLTAETLCWIFSELLQSFSCTS